MRLSILSNDSTDRDNFNKHGYYNLDSSLDFSLKAVYVSTCFKSFGS